MENYPEAFEGELQCGMMMEVLELGRVSYRIQAEKPYERDLECGLTSATPVLATYFLPTRLRLPSQLFFLCRYHIASSASNESNTTTSLTPRNPISQWYAPPFHPKLPLTNPRTPSSTQPSNSPPPSNATCPPHLAP